MKKPTRLEIRKYEKMYRLNSMFRDVDDALMATLTPDERVVVMILIWPAVRNIANAVTKRVISDFVAKGVNHYA